MRKTIFWVNLILFLLAITISGTAQATSPAAPPMSSSPPVPTGQPPKVQGSHSLPGEPKPPDMVCFGYGPNWSVQFINGEARYLGINEPDQYFLGDFYWVPEDKTWEWHRANGLAPMNGNFGLSASIQKAACNDPVRKQTYPYSAQVNLPQGDIVSGCCRKLKPGEAPVGQHGLTPQPQSSQQQGQPAQQQSAPSTQQQPSSQRPKPQ